ncbi:MAG TPA: hypothetical protein VFX97_01830, partial [Pyrinomonadaceae bacterium]|nr:hypothetical protein [Pyrinomonadaceae bacterium]
GVLPEGETLTGAWAFTGSDADDEFLVPISFPIELEEELFEENVQFTAGGTAACPGSFVAPTAAPGELCVYFNNAEAGEIINSTFDGIFKPGEPPEFFEFVEEGATPAGAIVRFLFDGEAGDLAVGSGTWAVTAAEAP